MTKIKMCGLFRKEDIDYANEVKPDYIGFVFYKKSSRYVDKEAAKSLKSLLDKDIKAVGVFVDEDISFIKELVEEEIIDLVQLHGHEDADYIRELRKLDVICNKQIPIIKAIQIKSSGIDKDTTYKSTDNVSISIRGYLDECNNRYSSLVDFYLLDSGMGSGSSFDWSLIQSLGKPIFLAGGLYPENVKSAIETVNPYAVDVSSGIETDKVKDIDKMRFFARNVRTL